MDSLELFGGAGGLAMGLARAGFNARAVIELDEHACHTLRRNQQLGILGEAPIVQADACDLNYTSFGKHISLVAGGPPCQPFSAAGKHLAQEDARNMFPTVVRALREVVPSAFIFENVRGLLRPAFTEYFEYLLLQFQYPNLVKGVRETWQRHRARLERYHTGTDKASTYNVVFTILNAADFGVPQKRERVFIVGFRSDLNAHWAFPKQRYSESALLHSKWITGEYWELHEIPKRQRPVVSADTLQALDTDEGRRGASLKRWRTVRDAIGDLPDPLSALSTHFHDHIYRRGAREYPGHTRSPMDEPAKTIKAGVKGVPGGENMFVAANGELRYFTIRELARLQTFPDLYRLDGVWMQTVRQLGNAVPVMLARVLGESIAATLKKTAQVSGATRTTG